ncbi:MAG: hypothetical protein ACRDQ1_20180, partial [Sciscionella sp.]
MSDPLLTSVEADDGDAAHGSPRPGRHDPFSCGLCDAARRRPFHALKAETLGMAQDVEDVAVGVSDEEPPHSPWFIGQR